MGLGPHFGEIEGDFDGRFGGQAHGLAGDIHRHVADPLQIVVDFQGRDDQAQIGGHRLVQGQGFQALFLDFDLKVIDFQIAINYFAGQGLVAIQNGLHGRLDLVFDQCA